MSELIVRLDEIVTGVLLAVLVVIVALQVLFRYLFYQPMGWTEEAGRYAFIWLSLLGAAVGVKYRAHFGFDVVVRTVPPPYRTALRLLIDSVGAIFSAAFMWFGAYLVVFTAHQTSPGLGVPMAVPYLAVPIAGGLMTVYFVRNVWTDLRSE